MKYAQLVERGCTCGTKARDCPLHPAGDNRGLRAWLEAGMPNGFPMTATCAVCFSDALLYSNVDQADHDKPFEFAPTLVCPSCSSPASERRLADAAVAAGHQLNDRRVFGAVAA